MGRGGDSGGGGSAVARSNRVGSDGPFRFDGPHPVDLSDPGGGRPEIREYWVRDNDRVSEIFHREDGPAVIYTDGSELWFRDGRRHREDGPAYIDCEGTEYWAQEGALHRQDGPAISALDGSQSWYWRDELHREDGPALIRSGGYRAWYRHGQLLYEEDSPPRTTH